LLPMMLTSCSGSTNSTGPAAPFPTGQNGSLALWTPTNAGCYVPDGTSPCSNTSTSGSYGITALTTLTVSASTLYLLVGDSQGNVYSWNASNSPTSSGTCSFSFSGTPVSGLASVPISGNYYVYAVAGNSLEVNSGSSICSGTLSSSINTALPGNTVGLVVANGYIYGVNSAGQYFSVDAGSFQFTQSPTTLPSLPSTATIGGVTADQNGIVFLTDYANSAIYAYYANSNGTLTRINGTLTGNVDVTNPKAITTVYAPNPTSTGCTTGACEFLYVTNYSQAVVQLVLSISGSGTSTNIGYTEFNAPYTSCEIINPVAMTSFPNVVSPAIPSSIPYVYIGENGTTTSSSCFGENSFGNNVTAYNLTGE
jgi:hypothetical protein